MTPLTAAQRSLWFAQSLDPASPFVIAQFVDLNGELDASRLESSTVAAHREFGVAGLRLRVTDGVPELVEDPDLTLVGGRLDFRRYDDPVRAAMTWMNREWSTATLAPDTALTVANLLQVGPHRWFWYYRAHHIALDGYSAALLMRRTAEIYLSAGPVRPDQVDSVVSDRVAAVARQESRYRESPRCVRDREFWHEKLRSVPSSPVLGASATGTSRGSTLRASGTVPLSDLSAATVIAAFASYVALMCGVDDLCLSLPVSGRVTAASRSLPGAMSNVVPLVLHGVDASTPSSAVCVVESALSEALRHQRYRREDMSALTDGRRQSRVQSFGPVVNIMLFDRTLTLGAVRGHVEILTTGPIDDIALNVYPGHTGNIRVDLEANGALYSSAELSAHHDRFVRFLEAFVDTPPDHPAPPLWTDAELGATSPARGEPSIEPRSLDSLLRSAVHRAVDSVAITDGDRSWTYGHLDRMAGLWSRHLKSVDVGPDDVVVVAIPRSIESVLAMWAVARVGATYVPIDPAHPAERVVDMLGVCKPRIGLTTFGMRHSLPYDLEWLFLDRDPDAFAPSFDPEPVHADHRAYMIFTSGSTGRPKAVSVTHRGLANLATDIREKYGLDSRSVVMHCASTSFDTSVVEMLAPALFGASSVICPPETVGGFELEDLICRHAVTHLLVTPSALATLAPERVPGLKFLIVGGEKLPHELMRRWAPFVRVRSAYGPTEATCSVTITDVLNVDDRVTLGRLMHGVEAVVLDASLEPLSTGAAGELYLSGPGLARGYEGGAGETAARFVASTLSAGHRMFRSGDRVRWTDDAQLEFLGRTDDQVKVRGRRIELGEIDSVLYGHPSVEFATTLVRDLANGSPALVSYVKLHTGILDSDASIERLLTQKLPEYMVPVVVIRIDAVPLTTNKKVDRGALPAPTFERRESVRVATPIESRIIRTYEEVLRATEIGHSDSFFDLGGDSLSATRVIGRLNADFGINLGFRDLFDSPSAAALASSFGQHVGWVPPLEQAVDASTPLLSPAQEYIGRELTSPALYNLPFTIRVRGRLDHDALASAVQDVMVRHETLRTVYPDVAGSPRPLVVNPDRIPRGLQVVEGNSSDAESIVHQTLSRGFDVRSEIPIRLIVCAYGRDDHLLAAVVHHIAADGWSLAILARDLSVAYEARARNTHPTWSETAVRYSDYAMWRTKILGAHEAPTDLAVGQLEHWAAVLDGAPSEISLPLDHTRPLMWTFGAGRVEFLVDPETHRGLTTSAKRAETGMFTVVHAVLTATLSALSGDHDIIVGSPVAGRGHPKLDDLVGMFVNTLVLRTRVDVSADFDALVAECRRVELLAHDHSDVQFERLVDYLDPPRHTSLHPFFQVALSFENFPAAVLESDGLTFEVTPRPLDIAKCDLHFHFAETFDETGEPAGIEAALVYSSDLFDAATATLFAKTLSATADALARSPEAPLLALDTRS
ncbi:amino acid adenylation domain-containing protein [Rhodococcus sp. (in: high G+C Gram-positive bacteria)]|uniref:amino acid adenylation domain-containing protein n=1 Tax=Rhodococcus sp. TaxID=1831 RepID=UPI00257AA127|nr:amino acid adenylation domain-containing protein [Rhodococcus sp. (in: high G+C Gram-positive bacteria)]MBQ9057049.1 amino acid adenylation domain-containing protein [Rhodococcus sp. (in: high G+C Gram-positive bacteria)]